MTASSTFRTRTLSQSVTEDLLRQIRAGEIQVGDQIPTQQELMKIYGVGHSVVRDAMQQLAAMGIVDVRPRRGATVISVDSSRALDDQLLAVLLDKHAIDDLYALRRLIEVDIAGQAAERATPGQLRTIERAHEQFIEARRVDLHVHQQDIEFHRAVAEASDNLVYLRVLDALVDVMTAIRQSATEVPGATEDAERQHAVILQAIREGHADAARNAMLEHIDTAIAVIHSEQYRPPVEVIEP